MTLRASSHTWLEACDQHTSSTLIGGEGGAGQSLLHSTLEGPTWYVNARWMWSLHGFLHGVDWIMFHGHYFKKPHVGRRPNTKHLEDHGTPNAHNRWVILLYHVWWPPSWIQIHWNSIWLRAQSHMASHYTLRARDHITWFGRCVGNGPWTLSFGPSQFHGHGSWLVCVKMALDAIYIWCSWCH